MFEINGVQLEYDAFDAETAGKLEAAKKEVINAITSSENVRSTEGIEAALRTQCKAIKKFFDDMFGIDTGKNICGEKDNLYKCTEAFGKFMKEDDRQSEVFKSNDAISFVLTKSRSDNMNRQGRRSKGR